MSSPNIRTSLLLALRRLLYWIFKRRPNLGGYFSRYLCRLCSWLVACWTEPTSPSNPVNPDIDVNTPKTTMIPYAVAKNGETLSLSQIAASQNPVPNEGLQKPSRSLSLSSPTQRRDVSQSLAHQRSMMPRRVSIDSCQVSLPSPNANSNPITPHSELHLTPPLKWSASMPHPQIEKKKLDHGEHINVEMMSPNSPGNHHQDSLHIHPVLPPSPSEPCVGNPIQHERISFEATPSSVPPATQELSHPNNQGQAGHRSHSHPHESMPRPFDFSSEKRYIQPAFPTETKRYAFRAKLCALYFAHINCFALTIQPVDQRWRQT